MRKLAVVLGLFVFAVTNMMAQTVWSRSFTLPGDGFLSGIADDHGTALMTHERLGGPCVIRISRDSQTLNEDCYGVQNEINGGRIALAKDGFFVYGSSFPEQQEPEAAFAFRIDAAGKLLWSRRYASPVPMRITCGAVTADGGLVMAGSLGRILEERYPFDGEKALIVKIDSSGKLLWHRVVDTGGADEFQDVRVTSDGIVAGGWSGSGSLAVKLRVDGRLVWSAVTPGTTIKAVEVVPGGDTVVAGLIEGNQWIARFDVAGRMEWQRRVSSGQSVITNLRVSPAGDVRAFAVSMAHTTILTFKNNGELASATSFPLPKSFSRAALTMRGAILVIGQAGPVDVVSLDGNGEAPACVEDGKPAPITFEPFNAATVDYPLDTGQSIVVEKAQAGGRTSISVALRESCHQPATAVAANQPSTSAADKEIEKAESAFRKEVQDLLVARKFDELDGRAADLRASRAEFSEGYPKANLFYESLADTKPFGGEQQHIARLREWRAHSPGSGAAAIALARAYDHYAWLIRGSAVASTITDSASERMAALSREAVRAVGDAAPLANGDPEYDVTRVEIFGSSCHDVMSIAYDPAVAQRKYGRFFRAAANFMMPRWCGSADEYRKYAEFAATAMGKQGDAIYARIGFDAMVVEASAPMGQPVSFFGTYKFDWLRMKRGFDDLIARYPRTAIYRHMLAFTAWKAGDRKTARDFLQQPDVAWNDVAAAVWRDPMLFQEAHDWALKPQADGFVEKIEPKLKAPESGPSGWIASAGKQWPPIVLRSTLRLRDGSQFADFNAFLVDTPGGVLAISATTRLDVRRGSQVSPYRIDELRTKVASWTMWSPSAPGKTFAVNSIEHGGVAWSGVSLTLASKNGKIPVQVLKTRSTPAMPNSRVYVVGCVPATGACKQTIYSAQLHGRIRSDNGGYGTVAVTFDDDVDWRDFAGSPVLDEDGFAVAVISNDALPPGERNKAFAVEIPLLAGTAK